MNENIFNVKRSLLIILIFFINLTAISILSPSEELTYTSLKIINVFHILYLLIFFHLVIFKWKGTWKDLGFYTENLRHDIKCVFYFIFGFGGIILFIMAISFIFFKINILPELVDYNLPIKDYKYMILYFFTTIFSAVLVEELVFRHIIYRSLRNKLNVFLSILITSFIFASLHLVSGLNLIIPMTGGILFAILYEMTGNLIAPVIMHAAGNLALTLISVFYRINTL
ncbi:CPBP family intramembrane metalloprotease [Candidatus Desantisbacteria bacterium]|nr:CPBP family intramembrane metalloprotease [Candidatus Desantisbacteria bacterium]